MDKKVSVPQSPEKLARHMADRPRSRMLLVGSLGNERTLRKFMKSVSFPSEYNQVLAGSTSGYNNLQVTTPDGRSFYLLEFTGNADLMLHIFSEAATNAGLPIADVYEQKISIRGEKEAIPVSACAGVLHNVWAGTV